jgi:hypothetical protein
LKRNIALLAQMLMGDRTARNAALRERKQLFLKLSSIEQTPSCVWYDLMDCAPMEDANAKEDFSRRG